MKKKHLFVLLLYFCFISCYHEEKRGFNSQHHEHIRHIDLSLDTFQPAISLIDSIHLISIKLDTTNIISKIDKVIFYKNKLLVVDKTYKSIQVLDLSGSFLYKIGGLGEGPGQYTTIDGVNIDEQNNKVIIFSAAKQKFIFFSLDGFFLEEKNMPVFVENFSLLPNNEIAIYTDFNPAKESKNYDLMILNKDYTIIEEFAPFSREEALGNGDSGNITGNKIGFLYSPTLSDTIYQYVKNNIYPKYQLKFKNKVVPPEYRKNIELFQQYFIKNINNLAFLRKSFLELDSSFLLLPYLDGKLTFAIYDNHSKLVYKETDLIAMHPIFEIVSSFSPFMGVKDDKTFISLIDNRKVMKMKNNPDFMERLKQMPYYEQISQMKDDNDFVLAFITLK